MLNISQLIGLIEERERISFELIPFQTYRFGNGSSFTCECHVDEDGDLYFTKVNGDKGNKAINCLYYHNYQICEISQLYRWLRETYNFDAYMSLICIEDKGENKSNILDLFFKKYEALTKRVSFKFA